MNLVESVRIAFAALAANKLRAALTMLGIIIGVAAVIALMSIGKGVQATVTAQIQGLGSNLVFIRPGAARDGRIVFGAGTQQTLTYEDAQALAEPGILPHVVGVAPELSQPAQIVTPGRNWATRVVGTTPDYEFVRNARPALGEFITKSHVEARSSVVVLGANVATNLFGAESPIDQTVRIALQGRTTTNFRVIGVLEPKGSTPLGNQDDQVIIPITTMYARVFANRTTRGQQTVNLINVAIDDPRNIAPTVATIGEILRQRHRVVEDDFTIQSQEDMLSTARQVTDVLTIFLGSVAGISLLVGGIGIMNIMLVSVTERTREIGIRKAVGAKRRDILAQFLVEAVVVSGVGGLVGIVLGMGIGRLLENLNLGTQRLVALVTPDAILLAFSVSVAIGLFFGIYPASRAAALNPIDALRYE
ncbi:MAG: ABC transporter permease [Chloroflexota bacterium]|nr:ABC transporter permease [Dehalococcoidia bacterium]MDW8254497.1 ABC transporter permease [Chloroflexota bacterium]